jgi:hypothetical protein
MAGMIVDLERNDGRFNVTRDAFRTKMRSQCDQAQRNLDELDAAREASRAFGFGIPSVPGAEFINEANVRAASIAQRAWFCSMKSGGKPTLAQSLATVTTLRTLTGGLYPMTTSKMTTTHGELCTYIDILNNGFAAPTSTGGTVSVTSNTYVKNDAASIARYLVLEKEPSASYPNDPRPMVVRARNANRQGLAGAMGTSACSVPLGTDQQSTAVRNVCIANRTAIVALYLSKNGPAPQQPGTADTRLVGIVVGGVVGTMVGGLGLGTGIGAAVGGWLTR